MLSLIYFFISTALATTVSLMPTQTYVPAGFDTNDSNVQIGFDSMYPDTCYHYSPTVSSVSETEKVIRIQNLSELNEDQFCAKVIRYFDEVVDLGMIETEGTYDVRFLTMNGDYRSVTKIKITKPEDSGSIDDNLYAPVVDARVVTKEGKKYARLRVKSAYQCLEFKSTDLKVTGNTLVVLPVIEEPQCAEDGRGHIIEKDVSLEGLSGRYLLHIRAMNSKAINKFIEI